MPDSPIPRRRLRARLAGTVAIATLATGLTVPAVAYSNPSSQPSATPDVVSLVRVQTPVRADKKHLTDLDLDLAEHAGPAFIDVVLHGKADEEKLASAGFRWSVLTADLAAADRAERAADREYAAKTRSSGLPSGRTSYRVLADYENEMEKLAAANPGLVKLVTLPEPSLQGRPVHGLEIARNVDKSDGRPVFLLMGLHHAREWPSGELAMEFAHDLVKNADSDARISGLLSAGRAIIVPVVNPDGFNRSRQAGDSEYKRKNCRQWDGSVEHPTQECDTVPDNGSGRGTDPNRNYAGFWGGPGTSDLWSSAIFRGSDGFSEPETRNIRDLFASHQVTLAISNHTYSNLVLRPPGVAGAADTPDETLYKAIGDELAAQNGYTSQKSYQLYDTTGTTEDWTYYATGSLDYTFEIGGSAFHPRYSNVVAEYLGSRKLAGNREAYLRAFGHAVNAENHARMTGTGPAGAVLRLRKDFSMRQWSGATFPNRLETTMTVPASADFTWDVNPSLRPLQDSNGWVTESWTLTCERPDGTVLETRQVTLGRGQQATLDLAACRAAF